MKNLNRKLSVIALSGMAVFGGVAASVVPAFASEVKLLQQEQDVSDPIVEEINQALHNQMGYFKVVGVVDSKAKAKEELKLSKYRKPNRSIVSVRKDNNEELNRVIGKFLRQNSYRFHSFAVWYKGKCYIISKK